MPEGYPGVKTGVSSSAGAFSKVLQCRTSVSFYTQETNFLLGLPLTSFTHPSSHKFPHPQFPEGQATSVRGEEINRSTTDQRQPLHGNCPGTCCLEMQFSPLGLQKSCWDNPPREPHPWSRVRVFTCLGHFLSSSDWAFLALLRYHKRSFPLCVAAALWPRAHTHLSTSSLWGLRRNTFSCSLL